MHKELKNDLIYENKESRKYLKQLNETKLEIEFKLEREENLLNGLIREYSVKLTFKEIRLHKKVIKNQIDKLTKLNLNYVELLNEIKLFELYNGLVVCNLEK